MVVLLKAIFKERIMKTEDAIYLYLPIHCNRKKFVTLLKLDSNQKN